MEAYQFATINVPAFTTNLATDGNCNDEHLRQRVTFYGDLSE